MYKLLTKYINLAGLLTQRLIEVQNRDIESSKLVEEFKLKLSQVNYLKLNSHLIFCNVDL